MVCRVLGDVTDQLRNLDNREFNDAMPMGDMYLDFSLELALEARPNDLALTRLETVDNRGDGADVVSLREENELLVDEVGDRNLALRVVEECIRLRPGKIVCPGWLKTSHTCSCLSHSLRSSAFFLLNARSTACLPSSSQGAKGITCFFIWPK